MNFLIGMLLRRMSSERQTRFVRVMLALWAIGILFVLVNLAADLIGLLFQ